MKQIESKNVEKEIKDIRRFIETNCMYNIVLSWTVGIILEFSIFCVCTSGSQHPAGLAAVNSPAPNYIL